MTARWTILACGDPSRGDDGAGLAVADRLARSGCADARIRRVGQLQAEDLIAALAHGPCIVVDAVRGGEAGQVVELPLGGLASASSDVVPASTHALPVDVTVRLAEALGADVELGTFVGVGGHAFELGAGLSPEVAQGIDAAAAAIERRLVAPRGAA
ncbi:MAG: hydrogenase maturation protease [Chloroflexota bacterium]